MNVPTTLVIVLIFASLLALLASGMWVGLAIGAVGLVMLTFLVKTPEMVGTIMYNTLSSYVLAAVPFFIFVGEIILESGLSDRLFAGASKWTKVVPGGLIQANIIACALLSAVSGSSVSTAAAVGTVAYPEEVKRGYNANLVTGSLVAGGTLGPMIPPSISMILYGGFVRVSVAKLFMGTLIPGMIMAAMFMLYIFMRHMLNPQLGPKRDALTLGYFRDSLTAWRDIWPFLPLVGIIFGGIYGGFMTPTEAAAVSAFVVIALVLALRAVSFAVLKRAAFSALKITAMVYLIVVSAKIMSYSLSMLGITHELLTAVSTSNLSPLAIWGLLALFYLLMGCFIDAVSMLFLTLPLVYPLMTSLGFDPIWFGVIQGITLEAGLLTPPVGMNLYVVQSFTKQPFDNVVRGSFPFFLLMLANIALLTFVPQLATWLPATIMGR